MRIIGCGVAQGDVELMEKINHFLGLEGSGVICNDFLRAAKSREDIGFEKLDNGGIIGLPAWYGFNPLGEIVSGCKNPFVLA